MPNISELSNDMFYLYDYWPKSSDNHKGISEEILAFKDNREKAIMRFTRDMIEALHEEYDGTDELNGALACIVPSHSAGEYSKAMCRMVMDLCNEFGMVYSYDLLFRIRTIPKLSLGGCRDEIVHLTSIKVNVQYSLTMKKIVIFDDVMTTGNSIYAVRKLLAIKEPRSITAIAIAKTVNT